MKKEETLRPKFYYGRNIAASIDDKNIVYAIGFYVGQMEKVVSGACKYCMFLPESQDIPHVENPIHELASLFGLVVNRFQKEFWICRPEHIEDFQNMCGLEFNSSDFHVLRAKMCGIATDYIDPEYHKRQGHNEYKKT